MLTLVGGVAASCLFLVLAIFPRCGGRAFRLPAHPHAHALQVTLGWLTVLVALILSITRQWTRIYRIYVNGKTERFHHALTDWLSLRPLATPLRLDGGVSSGAEHTTTTTIGLTWATATSYPDWSPSQPRGGSMALRRQRQAWNVKYALVVIPCEDTNCSPWGRRWCCQVHPATRKGPAHLKEEGRS